MQNSNCSSLVIFTISLFFTLGIRAQNHTNSPYSRFGLGEKISYSLHPYNSSLGGLSQGIRNESIINPQNPASYTSIPTGAFVFDIGFGGDITVLRNASQTTSPEGSASLSHLFFGFPITPYYKMSVGLTPFSQIGYHSSDTTHDPVFGRIKNSFEGEGGLNQVFWGHAIEPIKNLSIGLNMNFIFGDIKHYSSNEFIDSTIYYNSRKEQSVRIDNFSFEAGIQYSHPIKENYLLTNGFTYHFPVSFRTTLNEVSYSYIRNTPIDTSIHTQKKGDIRLPQIYNYGFTFQKTNKWMIGADVQYSLWSQHIFLDHTPENKTNSLLTSLGGELKGNTSSMSYLKRISLRCGLHYEQGIFVLDGEKVNDRGLHLGASFPMKKNKSTLNISFGYGKLGSSKKNQIEKDYIRIGISFSTADRWFIQRKYD